MIARERLFWDSSRRRIVKENDPAAAFLLVGVGGVVPKEWEKLIPIETSPVEIKTPESSIPRFKRR